MHGRQMLYMYRDDTGHAQLQSDLKWRAILGPGGGGGGGGDGNIFESRILFPFLNFTMFR